MEECLKVAERNHIHHVLIPENFTDRLQPLDVAVNKPVKDFMKPSFTSGMQSRLIGSSRMVKAHNLLTCD